MIQESKLLLILLVLVLVSACNPKTELNSPDGNINLSFNISENGTPSYSVKYLNKPILRDSKLGFEFTKMEKLSENFEIVDSKLNDVDQNWVTVWGPDELIRNNYSELSIQLKEKSDKKRKLNLYFRVFNDGVAFRYEFPEQENISEFSITNELTEFNFAENFSAWWIIADYNSYEKIYNNTPLSKVEWANTPITLENNDGLHISIHEAALTDYSGMTFKQAMNDSLSFHASLVPYANSDIKVKAKAPFITPWRTIQISPNASELVESKMILNLNEPNKIEDVSWIKPAKYIGIWWGMHLGLETWDLRGNHGATTENTKRYIDFAAENNIEGVLIEGWNTGWENWGKPEAFDFVTSYKDFDLEYLANYAAEKGVEIVGHHETGGDYISYEKFLDSALALYNRLGIEYLKTGYAGGISNGEHHHGQLMVQHYRKVVETAAKYKIMIDAHEPIKPTGISRTYPNMMTREGVRGMEWNAWSAGNPPEHTCILPFTRGLGGPIDYTPGIFDVSTKKFLKDRKEWNNYDVAKTRVHTTLAKQLALMVVLYSPLQMAADLIENYEDQPAFKFISDLNVDFDESKVLNGKIGDYITVARKVGDEWFIGSITDENERTFEIKLDFLPKGKKFTAEIYADGKDADWETNPIAIDISSADVTSESSIKLELAKGGGQAIRIYQKK